MSCLLTSLVSPILKRQLELARHVLVITFGFVDLRPASLPYLQRDF